MSSEQEIRKYGNAQYRPLVFLAILTCPMFICTVVYIFIFIRYQCKLPKDKKSSKCLFASGLIFFLASSILLLLLTIFLIDVGEAAWTAQSYWEWRSVFGQTVDGFFVLFPLYELQIYMLWITMYVRLKNVFKDSVHAISKCTHVCMVTLFILLPLIMYIIHSYSLEIFSDFTEYPTVTFGSAYSGQLSWAYSGSVFFSFLLFNAVSLVFSGLFICKLYKIHKMTAMQNTVGGIASVMARTILLALISFSISLVVAAMGVFIFHYFVNIFFWIFDIFSNFICLGLTYSVFNKQYEFCCGCLDKKFKKCVFKVRTVPSVEISSPKSCDSPTASV